VKLDDSSIVYCKNDRSVYLDSIKLISPGILRRFSEIRKIKINGETKHKDNLAMLCKFLVKCDELKSLDLGSNNIGMEEHFSSRPHFIQKSNGMHNFFAIGWIFIIFMVSRDHIYVPSKKWWLPQFSACTSTWSTLNTNRLTEISQNFAQIFGKWSYFYEYQMSQKYYSDFF